MKPRSGKVQIWRELKKDHESCVEWAISLLEEGHDTRSLRILAGLTPPYNPWEIETYLNKAFQELDIPILRGDDAIKAYTYEILIDLIKKEIDSEQALKILRDIFTQKEHIEYLYDFWLLSYAKEDLKEDEAQSYWPGANQKNIEKIIFEKAETWIRNYEMESP